MPVAKIKMEDGRIAKFEVPEGTSEQDIISYAKKFSTNATANTANNAMKSIEDIRAEVKAERGDTSASFIQSMGRGMLDVYQGGIQLGNHIAKFLDEGSPAAKYIQTFPPVAIAAQAMKAAYNKGDEEKYDKKLQSELSIYNENNPGFSFGRLAGNIATPLSLIPGGGGAGVGARVLTGAATGMASSSLQPVESGNDFFSEKFKQAATGAAFGVGLPIAAKGVKTFFSYLDEITKPLYKKGIQRDVAKYLNKFIDENREKITQAVKKAYQNGDDKTVGQILAEANTGSSDDFGGMIIRLEKDLSKESDALKSLYAMQSESRRKVIDGIAGSEDDLINAVKNRESIAAKNYADAFQVPVSVDKKLIDLSKNKYFKSAVSVANDLAEANKVSPKERMTEYLHYIKIGLDKQLSKSGDDALSNAERRAVGRIKDELTEWIGKKNPLYEKARTQYQVDSLPINRMQVGQYLKDKLVSSLDENRPSVFNQAVRDAAQTIKKSTGFARYDDLGKILDPSEVKNIKNVAKELITDRKAASMAEASKSIMKDLSGEIEISLPHILSRPVVITNHALKMLGQDKTPEYKKLLISLMQDKKAFIDAYKLPSENKKAKMAADILNKLTTISGSQQLAREQN